MTCGMLLTWIGLSSMMATQIFYSQQSFHLASQSCQSSSVADSQGDLIEIEKCDVTLTPTMTNSKILLMSLEALVIVGVSLDVFMSFFKERYDKLKEGISSLLSTVRAYGHTVRVSIYELWTGRPYSG
jgi:hypothetical protein